MKTGIITFHRAYNYGAELQAYALCKKICDWGHEAEIIDYRDKYKRPLLEKPKHLTIKNFLKAVVQVVYRLRKHQKFDRFAHIHIPTSEVVYRGHDELVTMDQKHYYDAYVVGSDQIWNFGSGYDETFLLDFVSDSEKKCAYAPSMAGGTIPKDRYLYYKELIWHFRVLSLREECDIVRNSDFFGANIRPAVDPTLLLFANDYKKIMSRRLTSGKYIFFYTIGVPRELKKLAQKTAREKGLKLIDSKRSPEIFLHCGPEDFLSWICHADYVFTNSFHGTAFSIIFKKQFVIELKNKNGGFNSRSGDLMDKLGLGGRDIEANGFSLDQKIDWRSVSKQLDAMRVDSENVLCDILYEKHRQYITPAAQPGSDSEPQPGCCGCGACAAVCPHDAITMTEKTFGFRYPVIDSETCISCGLCKSVCPMSGASTHPTNFQPKYYSARHTDEGVVKHSSSGGVFSAISDQILKDGGVVYGCALDRNMEAVHIRAETAAERDRMRGSKYVQSDCMAAYEQTYLDLSTGRKVLYSGTPCQIAAMYRYLKAKKADIDRFYTQEVLCLGVACPSYFRNYIADMERKYGGKAISCNFRAHRKPGKKQDMEICFDNGRTYHASSTVEEPFYKFYHQNIILRPSCYNCPYAVLERTADITLADFWEELPANKGSKNKAYSFLIVSTEKGKQLLDKSDTTLELTACTVEDVHQSALYHPAFKPFNYDIFCSDYLRYGYRYIQKKYGNDNFKGHVKLPVYRIADTLGLSETGKAVRRKLMKLVHH